MGVGGRADHGDETVAAVTDVGPEDDSLGFDAELLAGKVGVGGVPARSREALAPDERVVDLLGALVTEGVAVVRRVVEGVAEAGDSSGAGIDLLVPPAARRVVQQLRVGALKEKAETVEVIQALFEERNA